MEATSMQLSMLCLMVSVLSDCLDFCLLMWSASLFESNAVAMLLSACIADGQFSSVINKKTKKKQVRTPICVKSRFSFCLPSYQLDSAASAQYIADALVYIGVSQKEDERRSIQQREASAAAAGKVLEVPRRQSAGGQRDRAGRMRDPTRSGRGQPSSSVTNAWVSSGRLLITTVMWEQVCFVSFPFGAFAYAIDFGLLLASLRWP